MKPRRTRQLTAVYEVVRAAHDHPTAEEVCERVRRQVPRISLGTVYRNLQKLAQARQVRVVPLAERPARYDAIVQEHDHFLCEGCGDVADLTQAVTRPSYAALRASGFQVRAHALTLYGLCPRCRGHEKIRAARRRRQRGTHGA